jgi:starch-binding outer membrane protein, SusD/RagB family
MQSCIKEYTDPSRPLDVDVFSSIKGITGVAAGLQTQYTIGRQSPLYGMVTSSGFLTNELVILNTGNTDEAQLSVGGNTLDNLNGIVGNMWAYCNKIVYDADKVLAASSIVTDPGYASGLIGYTSIMKALAQGTMATYWENIPDGNGTITTSAGYITRTEGYNKAIATIDAALTKISANAISPAFYSNIPGGIDIPNTLQALKARYCFFNSRQCS